MTGLRPIQCENVMRSTKVNVKSGAVWRSIFPFRPIRCPEVATTTESIPLDDRTVTRHLCERCAATTGYEHNEQ